MERTLSIIKPDAVERNLENKIKYFFEEKNLKVIKSKKIKKIFTKKYLPYEIGFVSKEKKRINTFGKIQW